MSYAEWEKGNGKSFRKQNSKPNIAQIKSHRNICSEYLWVIHE